MTPFHLIENAFKEDMPNGDITTDSLGLSSHLGFAQLVAKEDLVLSGTGLFREAIHHLNPECNINWLFKNGDWVLKGQTIATLEGNLIAIIKAERIGLNFLGKLCGIATLTRCFVKQIEHTQCKILDTRKTTPTFREQEKQAVVHGKGTNHRYNLSDAILVKENHIHLAGGISQAVHQIRQRSTLPIEVETTDLVEVKEAVKNKVARILLDNMNNEQLTEAIKLIPPEIETEASGNMSIERVKSVAEVGVTYISVGAITHSAPCADVSLLFDWNTK